MTIFEPTPSEKLVLQDIERRAGLSFRRIGGIDTRDARIANAVLPILLEWADRIKDDIPGRSEILWRFATPHAQPYLNHIEQWWIEEKDNVTSIFLTGALELVADSANAGRIWNLWKEHPKDPKQTSPYRLMAKLSTFASVEREVKDEIVRVLEAGNLRIGDLSDISVVDDPRIRGWFRRQTNSPDARVRRLAQKVIGKRMPLPRGVEVAAFGPDRRKEAFSTEVDLAEIKPLLEKLAKEFGLKMPSAVKKAEFLSRLDLDQWVVAQVSTDEASPAGLWFRLEDIDTVEVAVLKSVEGESSTEIVLN